MSSNEYGCKVLAESCVELKNGDKYYVDDKIEDLEKQMAQPDKGSIHVEVTMIISKGGKRSIKRSEIKEFYSNGQ